MSWGVFDCLFSFVFFEGICWEGETEEYKAMDHMIRKSRNWKIMLWFISWKENITPYHTLKMTHLRHWTKWICLIHHINWKIPNEITWCLTHCIYFQWSATFICFYFICFCSRQFLTEILQDSKIIQNAFCKMF